MTAGRWGEVWKVLVLEGGGGARATVGGGRSNTIV